MFPQLTPEICRDLQLNLMYMCIPDNLLRPLFLTFLHLFVLLEDLARLLLNVGVPSVT